jgi:hypothetical protein
MCHVQSLKKNFYLGALSSFDYLVMTVFILQLKII